MKPSEIPDWMLADGPPPDEGAYGAVVDDGVLDPQAPADLPVVKVVNGELPRVADEGEAALVAGAAPIYQRGGQLVRPVVEEVDAAHGRRANVARLAGVQPAYLRDQLGRRARWLKYIKSREEWSRIDPPVEVAATIGARAGEWKFRHVTGIAACPTLRPDGTVLSAPGYDPQSRLILAHGVDVSGMPARPTKADAQDALSLLEDLLGDFPLVDAASRAVALSGLMTPVVRGAFSVAPLHVYRAPTPGTGKSYLVDLAAAIALGTRAPVLSAGRDEAEMEKRLGAALLAGNPLVSIDNVNGELAGDFLCQAVERQVVEVRPLGKSEIVRIENRATMFSTGNNARVVGDLVRRVVIASLDASVERPEMRQFRGNPFVKVLRDRGRYVAAALTVVRAYVEAGRPDRLPALGSFEGWSATVRSALVWLGCADPVATMEAAREDDPEIAVLAAVIDGLSGFGANGPGNAYTAAELIDEANRGNDVLRQALDAAVGMRGMIDAKRLGKWLAGRRGRIVAGRRIADRGGDHGHAKRFFVEAVGAV
jgi:putative DNA primase/helicase